MLAACPLPGKIHYRNAGNPGQWGIVQGEGRSSEVEDPNFDSLPPWLYGSVVAEPCRLDLNIH